MPFGPSPSILDNEKCYNIIIDKSSSSKQLEEVKDFLIREETVYRNKLSNVMTLFDKAEIEYNKALVRESK